MIAARAAASLVALALFGCSPPSPHNNQFTGAASDRAVDDPAPRVVFMDAADLVHAVRRDPAGVARQFTRDRVMLKGTVLRVGHVDAHMTEIIVHTPGQPGTVSLFAADDEIDAARAEQPGKLIAVSCTDVMPPADDITARDCVGFD